MHRKQPLIIRYRWLDSSESKICSAGQAWQTTKNIKQPLWMSDGCHFYCIVSSHNHPPPLRLYLGIDLCCCVSKRSFCHLPSLKLTAIAPARFSRAPKGNDRLPTVHFQVLLLLVSGEDNSTPQIKTTWATATQPLADIPLNPDWFLMGSLFHGLFYYHPYITG